MFVILILSAMLVSGCVATQNQTINETRNNTIIQTPEQNVTQNQTQPQEQPKQELIINGFDYYKIVPNQTAINDLLAANKFYSVTFLYTFPIAKMPMHYYFYNDTAIEHVAYNQTVKQIWYAFHYWENAADSKLKFNEVFSEEEADIVIKLADNYADERLNHPNLGSAEPKYIARSGYTIMTGGKITTEASGNSYPARTVLMHQIGHILGFGHSTSQTSIMNENYLPGGDLQQKINIDTIKVMEILYKDTPIF
jgi:hypothetical protein